MPRARLIIVSTFASVVIFPWESVVAQPPEGSEPVVSVRCEAFCSDTKARTANARLSWIDPGVVIARAHGSARVELEQQVETTVFKNGFTNELFARFPAVEPTPAGVPRTMELPGRRSAAPIPRAFDLRIIGATRPRATGIGAAEIMRLSPQQQETSIIVEGLEPGLNYWWRIRFRTSDGEWRLSEPIRCEAPVCPADMLEEL